MTFSILMGILATVLIIAMVIGEERFNKWFACKHDFVCLDEQGKIDNKNPVRITCKKCGRDSKIENK